MAAEHLVDPLDPCPCQHAAEDVGSIVFDMLKNSFGAGSIGRNSDSSKKAALPHIVVVDLGYRDVVTGAQPVFQSFDDVALLL